MKCPRCRRQCGELPLKVRKYIGIRLIETIERNDLCAMCLEQKYGGPGIRLEFVYAKKGGKR